MTAPNWNLLARGWEFGRAPRLAIYAVKVGIGVAVSLLLAALELLAIGRVHVLSIAVLMLLGQAALKVRGYTQPDAERHGWKLDRYAPLDWICDAALVTGLGLVALVWLRHGGAAAGQLAVYSLVAIGITYGWSRE